MFKFRVENESGVINEGTCNALVLCGTSKNLGIAYSVLSKYDRISGTNLLFDLLETIGMLQLASEEIGERIRRLAPNMSQEDLEHGIRLAMVMIRDRMAAHQDQVVQNENMEVVGDAQS